MSSSLSTNNEIHAIANNPPLSAIARKIAGRLCPPPRSGPTLPEGRPRHSATTNYGPRPPEDEKAHSSVVAATRSLRSEVELAAACSVEERLPLLVDEDQRGALLSRTATTPGRLVATLREWRGKGVASALIVHALTTQGYDSAGSASTPTTPLEPSPCTPGPDTR
jgi:hypothetical protein